MRVVNATEVKSTMSTEVAREVKLIFFGIGVAVDQLAKREGLDQNAIMCALYYLMRDFLSTEGIDVTNGAIICDFTGGDEA